ncbi:winged helix-turn-helix domain-containing protein [Anoxybacillus ayderensis]|uniref:winged helix-turn-helix domain-containing protein n=1 Tax=Anoxybacillus ayderensis TaxID=265546 RepID=UPI002E203F9D|nr:winged helix-turn-helix domain-containing protein [Anoxybacillus ayderensis]
MNKREKVFMPENAAIQYQLLQLLYYRHMSGEVRPLKTQEAYKLLESIFNLSNAQKEAVNADGSSVWETRVRAAYEGLKKCGAVYAPNRGELSLTDNGLKMMHELIYEIKELSYKHSLQSE